MTSWQVPLTLSAEDAGSGIAQMRFSNDGESWSAWEQHRTTKVWSLLPQSGERVVYVQYQDAVGNVSGSYGDTVWLELEEVYLPLICRE